MRLSQMGEPAVVESEAIGVRLYTGPCFVKYNGVLRGLGSDVPFLRRAMIELCCSKAVTSGYVAGSIPFESCTADLNTYTTTLHVREARFEPARL